MVLKRVGIMFLMTVLMFVLILKKRKMELIMKINFINIDLLFIARVKFVKVAQLFQPRPTNII